MPVVPSGHVLIRSLASLVSSGTERSLVDFGKANLFSKVKQQPDKVKEALDKLQSDGVLPTISAIASKLDQPIPLGYSNVGIVAAIGDDVAEFSVGDRVVSNGPHAEFVVAPVNLCAPVPDSVTTDSACFTVLASIGLQGIRLSQPTFGETFLVSGLGLIGLLTVQLLRAQGCRVLGIDPDPHKCELAASFGAFTFVLTSGSDPLSWLLHQTNDIGIDGALITASTTSDQPVHLAAQASRQRGRIILVGVTGLNLRRDDFYKKELSFQVSCSYGPGRYDSIYEIQGVDYPLGFVRWTEKRNFEAVLQAFANKTLNCDKLISHRFSLEDASAAYDLLTSSSKPLGILITYPPSLDVGKDFVSLSQSCVPDSPVLSSTPSLSVIGAGNYASRVLIPSFAKSNPKFHTIAANSGFSPVYIGRKFGFQNATTDVEQLIASPDCNAVVIASRHDSHADLICRSLSASKHVFVEKPLCLTREELAAVKQAHNGERLLMVGFNRRFAPLVIDLRKQLLRLTGPKAFVYTCNAGSIPADHWTQIPHIGGGRLLGEACHFVDLLRFLVGSPIEDLQLHSVTDRKQCPDTFTLQMRFVDGSIGTVHYFSNGSKSFPKERLEVFSAGKVIQLENFRKLKAWGIPGFQTRRLLQQDKGQVACCTAFLDSITNGAPPPIPISEIFEVQNLLLEALSQ